MINITMSYSIQINVDPRNEILIKTEQIIETYLLH
jgi:hypothetical protein